MPFIYKIKIIHKLHSGCHTEHGNALNKSIENGFSLTAFDLLTSYLQVSLFSLKLKTPVQDLQSTVNNTLLSIKKLYYVYPLST